MLPTLSYRNVGEHKNQNIQITNPVLDKPFAWADLNPKTTQ